MNLMFCATRMDMSLDFYLYLKVICNLSNFKYFFSFRNQGRTEVRLYENFIEIVSWTWWCISVVPALGRKGWVDQEFRDILCY